MKSLFFIILLIERLLWYDPRMDNSTRNETLAILLYHFLGTAIFRHSFDSLRLYRKPQSAVDPEDKFCKI